MGDCNGCNSCEGLTQEQKEQMKRLDEAVYHISAIQDELHEKYPDNINLIDKWQEIFNKIEDEDGLSAALFMMDADMAELRKK